MISKLFIIKDSRGYIRFTQGGHHHCDMNKASVFSLDSIDKVKQKLTTLKTAGNSEAAIYLLTITEERFRGE